MWIDNWKRSVVVLLLYLRNLASDTSNTTLYIPHHCNYTITGGETIKSINQTTGAHCEVDRNAPPDARDKNFIIRGTPEQVERAKSMIMEKIGMPGPGGGGGGYGGPSYGAQQSSWGGGGGQGGYQQGGGYQPEPSE